MAIVAGPTAKELFLKALSMIFSPWMIASYVICLTLPFWAGAVIYALLNSFSFAPSGLIAWILVVALSGLVIWAWGAFAVQMARTVKSLRLLRLLAAGGDQQAFAKYVAARKSPPPVWKHAVAFTALQILIPTAASLVIWSYIRNEPGLVRGPGKPRLESPQESLHRMIRILEKRGIWTSFARDP